MPPQTIKYIDPTFIHALAPPEWEEYWHAQVDGEIFFTESAISKGQAEYIELAGDAEQLCVYNCLSREDAEKKLDGFKLRLARAIVRKVLPQIID